MQVRLGALLISLSLSGCVSIPSDRGLSMSSEFLNTRSVVAGGVAQAADAAQANTAANDLLAHPLSVDDAVRVALLRNPTITVLYSDLGIGQAEVYEATHLSNPSIGYSRISGAGSARTQWSISQNLTELLFMRYRARLGRNQLLQTQQRVALQVLDLESQVRSQYFRYVGMVAMTKLREQSADTNLAAARYAKQLYDAGNISALQLSREQAAASQADIDRQHARVELLAERVALLDLMGLSVATHVQFVEEFSPSATVVSDRDALQRRALENRLDLLAAREDLDAQSAVLQHTRWWHWFGGVSVGAERETEHPNGRPDEGRSGPAATIELPIFNHGTARQLRARAEFDKAKSRVAALELSIANQVLVRVESLQSANTVADIYRNQLVPLRERIVKLEQERQTFMLIGLPELLAAKRDQLETQRNYLAALRDCWLALVQLQRVLGTSQGLVAEQLIEDERSAP